jgi:hypothetical protein
MVSQSEEPPNVDGSPEDVAEERTVPLAWRLLTSPRTFLATSALIALLFAWAATLPQRPLASELARRMPFASAEAITGLGLDDVLVSWPLFLLVAVLVLNAAGIALARRLGTGGPGSRLFSRLATTLPYPVEAVRAELPRALGGSVAAQLKPGGLILRRGFYREGAALVVLGVLALGLALVVSRGSAVEHRLTVIPATGVLSTAETRHDDVFIAQVLPWGVMCDRPDPQDPTRTVPCRVAGPGESPVELALAPGGTTHLDERVFSLVREVPRVPALDEPIELVMTRDGRAERVRLDPGKPVELRATGHKLTAWPGPDGPLVVLEKPASADQPARTVLLTPPKTAVVPTGPAATAAQTVDGLRFEARPATTIEVRATTSPEAPLVLAGLAMVVLGLILMGALPHLEVTVSAAPGGSRLELSSHNRPFLPERVLAAVGRLLARPS